jgi:hypothetical protein
MRISEICVGTEWQNMEVMMKDRNLLTLYNSIHETGRRGMHKTMYRESKEYDAK